MSQNPESSVESRPSPTIEDYLGLIYLMDRDGKPVIAARLADIFEVSPPTVTNTLKRMARDGWLEVDSQKNIHLTLAGREAASSLIRRHMLTEWMLTRVFKVPWSHIHQEAHQIEHTLSEDMENRLAVSMEEPQTCPHGNPLPGYEHVAKAWVCLQDILPGQEVIIRRIHESAEDHPEILSFLESNGIMPGARVKVREILAFNETITLETNQQAISLGYNTARYVFVEPVLSSAGVG